MNLLKTISEFLFLDSAVQESEQRIKNHDHSNYTMKEKAKQHGGPRPGSGRPATGEETTTIGFRVPKEKATSIKKKILAILPDLIGKTGKKK